MSRKEKLKCKISGKSIFETHSQAKEVMIAFKNRQRLKINGKRIKHRQGKAEVKRVYFCSFCDGYHITKESHYRENYAEENMQMTKENEEKFHRSRNGHWKEVWETIEFDFEITNESRWEISSWGRVRSFNKTSDGKLLKGSLIEGYRVIKLKLYKPRESKTQKKFDDLQKQLTNLYKQRRIQINKKDLANTIALTTQQIDKKKTELSKQFANNLKQRTINYHFLIHRKVAEHFLSTPEPEQTIVGHIDFDKLNNKTNNLRWMTPDENKKHQANSPYVVAEKRQRKHSRAESSKASKLTVTKVMLIKKILKERGGTLKQVAKQFKVSDMQIHRIKTGENWGHIKAAN